MLNCTSPRPADGYAYEVEFVTAGPDTATVLTFSGDEIRSVGCRKIFRAQGVV